jgi:hypothetical protein
MAGVLQRFKLKLFQTALQYVCPGVVVIDLGEELVVGMGKILAIQHRLNPLHLYCRFLDRGLSKRLSFSLCRSYEVLIFIWVSFFIKTTIYFYSIIDRNFSVLEELRKK